jgi:hypothetical protein
MIGRDRDEIVRGCGKILRLEHSSLQFHVGGAYAMGTGLNVAAKLGDTSTGQWVHVAGTYDREVARLIVNGSKVAAKPFYQPLAANPNPLLVGKSGFGHEEILCHTHRTGI